MPVRVDQTRQALATLPMLTPITDLALEHVRFATQKLGKREISGGINPNRARVGIRSAGVPAGEMGPGLGVRRCRPCSAGGGAYPAQEPGWDGPGRQCGLGGSRLQPSEGESDICQGIRVSRHRAQARKPLRDAVMMHATRRGFYGQLQATGLPVEGGLGGSQDDAADCSRLPQGTLHRRALCGAQAHRMASPLWPSPRRSGCKGTGHPRRCGTDAYGFPTRHRSRPQCLSDFRPGTLCGRW